MERKSIYNEMKLFPKVDLHCHLEGSIFPETFLEVAKKYGGELPAYDLDKLRSFVQVTKGNYDFKDFLSKFLVFRNFYESREAIYEVTYQTVKKAALDNVKYLELRFSPTHFAARRKFKEAEVVLWIRDAIAEASREFNIIVTPVLTISRDFPVALAQKTVEIAIKMQDRFFCGLDIAGNEISNSAEPFTRLFLTAKKAGLGITVHAGEAGGPENVRSAVLDLHADRIGHGIRSVESAELIDLLIQRNVMLEICITSNIHTGVVKSIEKHPLKILKDLRVPFCINTDDPGVSGITLTDEYCRAVNDFDFKIDDLKKMNLSALEHSFYPDRPYLKKILSYWWK